MFFLDAEYIIIYLYPQKLESDPLYNIITIYNHRPTQGSTLLIFGTCLPRCRYIFQPLQ